MCSLLKILVSRSLTSLNLADNELCGLNQYGQGTYTSEGIKAIADALKGNASLTQVLAIDRKLCCFTFLGLTFTHHRCPLCVLDSLICQSTHCAVWTSMARAPTPLRA